MLVGNKLYISSCPIVILSCAQDDKFLVLFVSEIGNNLNFSCFTIGRLHIIIE